MDMMQGQMPQDAEQAGVAVTITAMPDGTFTVAPEGGDMGMGGESQEPAGQPAASIDEALELARQMLSQDARSPEEAMMDGYNGSKPAARKQTPAQVFGG